MNFRLFDPVHHPVMVIDLQNIVRYCNPACVEAMGIEQSLENQDVRLDHIMAVDQTEVFEKALNHEHGDATEFHRVYFKVISSSFKGVMNIAVMPWSISNSDRYYILFMRDIQKRESTQQLLDRKARESLQLQAEIAKLKKVSEEEGSKEFLSQMDESIISESGNPLFAKLNLDSETPSASGGPTDVVGAVANKLLEKKTAKFEEPLTVHLNNGAVQAKGRGVYLTMDGLEVIVKCSQAKEGESAFLEVHGAGAISAFHCSCKIAKVFADDKSLEEGEVFLNLEFEKLSARGRQIVTEFVNQNYIR